MIDINKNDKILITGGTGFVGSTLTTYLKELGYTNILSIGSKECDLRIGTDIYSYLFRHNPNIIIHCAATVGGIGRNQTESGKLCYENLIMGLNIIEGARLYCSNLKKFVLLSTVCSYPHTPPHIPFKEEDIWEGFPEKTNGSYAIAKKALMILLQSYKKDYNFPGITLLPCNLFGPGDSLDIVNNHVIPALISKILKAKSSGEKYVEIWGDGSASREFLYVKDCARAIVLAMEKYEKSDPVNIGTGKEIKISELVEKLLNKIGFSGYIKYDKSKPNGQPRRCLDVSRAEKEFGFVAETDFDVALDNTIRWVESKLPLKTNYYGEATIEYPVIDVRKVEDK